MEWLYSFTAEFALTVMNAEVWQSIAYALVFAATTLALGAWSARRVGVLAMDAPPGEVLAVGLATGLVVVAAIWAAVASGGQSVFTPVAMMFVVVAVLSVLPSQAPEIDRPAAPPVRRTLPTLVLIGASARRMFPAAAFGASFIVAVALLYGATMAQSPRDGVQPLEFMDTAYYAILGADVAATGIEDGLSPSGLSPIDGLPKQTWYHWGEIWLASAVIRLTGEAPIAARTLVVLPVLLLAAASLTGSLVRRVARTTSRGAYVVGFLTCLFLAPVPVLSGPFFSTWAVGMIFGITLYGLAAVAVLLALHALVTSGGSAASWRRDGFLASVSTSILPAHLLLALLAVVGVATAWTVQMIVNRGRAAAHRSGSWRFRRAAVLTCSGLVATAGWGLITGHGIYGSGASSTVLPFNGTWAASVGITALGSGAFLAIPAAWIATRGNGVAADIFVGGAGLLAAGAVAWGARLSDFNMFYVYFGAIAVFLTPAAAIAVWSIWSRSRKVGHRSVAVAMLLLWSAQIEFGAAFGILRLQRFGPGNYEPVPVDLLAAIRSLPPTAKLAYTCRPLEEQSVWDPRLLALSAHTARRIIPMCFMADSFGPLVGGDTSLETMSPLFASAPQRMLYPSYDSAPSKIEILRFLNEHGIAYIYEDAAHPNRIAPGAIQVAAVGEFRILKVP